MILTEIHDALLGPEALGAGVFRNKGTMPAVLRRDEADRRIVGDFCGDFTDATGLTQGFVSIGGTITPFSVPGATLTIALGLNGSNQAAGYYVDASGISHGFWRGSNGLCTSRSILQAPP